jgi:hypothetical protein
MKLAVLIAGGAAAVALLGIGGSLGSEAQQALTIRSTAAECPSPSPAATVVPAGVGSDASDPDPCATAVAGAKAP